MVLGGVTAEGAVRLGFDEVVFFAALGGELAAAGEGGGKVDVDEGGSGAEGGDENEEGRRETEN